MEYVEKYHNVTISIDDLSKPPLVTIDGMTYPIVTVSYLYETYTEIRGEHSILIEYVAHSNATAKIRGFRKGGRSLYESC